jgi:hypothetical protein
MHRKTVSRALLARSMMEDMFTAKSAERITTNRRAVKPDARLVVLLGMQDQQLATGKLARSMPTVTVRWVSTSSTQFTVYLALLEATPLRETRRSASIVKVIVSLLRTMSSKSPRVSISMRPMSSMLKPILSVRCARMDCKPIPSRVSALVLRGCSGTSRSAHPAQQTPLALTSSAHHALHVPQG